MRGQRGSAKVSDRKAHPEDTRPPSGVTVLIVSLGLLRTPTRMATITVGVALRTAACWLADRASGLPVPVWDATG